MLTPQRGDAGFTLTELVISIAVLGVVLTALGGAMSTLFNVKKSTYDDLSASHDTQLAASYFNSDALGRTDVAYAASTVCNTPTDATTQLVVRFTGTDVVPSASPRPSPTPASPVTDVPVTTGYLWLDGATPDAKLLQRITCRTVNGSVAAVERTTLARRVLSKPYVTSGCTDSAAPPATPPAASTEQLALVVPLSNGVTTQPVVLCATRRVA